MSFDKTEFSFAPLEGITYPVFRRLHAEMFPGAAEYYTPFIAPNGDGSFKSNFLRSLTPELPGGVKTVPQQLANSAHAFVLVAQRLQEIGFEEVNLNVGCPSATVFSKYKGAGMLRDLGTLQHFLDEAFEQCPIRISIKTRMGLESTAEFPRILEVYNRYPIAKLIIHARDRAGQYVSEPDLEGYAEAVRNSRAPVIYNGNIFAEADVERVMTAAPGTAGFMVGRGAIADPALIRRLRGGAPLSAEELRSFHDRLLQANLDNGLSPRFTSERMKGFWTYMHVMFIDSEKALKTIHKARGLEEYRMAIDRIFRECRFDPYGSFASQQKNMKPVTKFEGDKKL